jgi:hypothetical protein
VDPSPIEIARENATFSLQMSLQTSSSKLDRDPYLLAQIAVRYHMLAIVAVLADSDCATFVRRLAQSGQTDCFLRGLDLSADPAHWAASRHVPFADALAAGDLASARTIATLAPDFHQEGWEYEDDYLRSRFMHRLLLAPDDQPLLERMLERWDAVAEGRPGPYHDLSHALLARDEVLFDEALNAVLASRRVTFAEWRKTPEFRVEIDAVDGGLFVLGLAYLRLAELRGIVTRPDYDSMPALARVPLGTPLPPPGSWRVGVT